MKDNDVNNINEYLAIGLIVLIGSVAITALMALAEWFVPGIMQ